MGKQKLRQENKRDYFTVRSVAKRRAGEWVVVVVYESQDGGTETVKTMARRQDGRDWGWG